MEISFKNQIVNDADIVFLDYAKGDGITYIPTDILFSDVRNTVEVDAHKEEREYVDSDDCWIGIMFAGAQKNESLQFAFTNMDGSISESWYHNYIYFDSTSGENGRHVVRLYKETDEAGSKDVYSKIDDGQFNKVTNVPGWTTAKHVSPKPISFFGTLCNGKIKQQSSKTKFYGAKIYEQQTDKVLYDFVPVMVNDIAGIYEKVTKKFFPEDPSGKLVCCLNGKILQR